MVYISNESASKSTDRAPEKPSPNLQESDKSTSRAAQMEITHRYSAEVNGQVSKLLSRGAKYGTVVYKSVVCHLNSDLKAYEADISLLYIYWYRVLTRI